MSIFRAFLWMVVVLFAAACTKSTLVGSELLENEKVNVQFTDSLTLQFTTVKDDSVQTYPANIDRRRESFLLGNLEDPVFGVSTSDIYMQLGLSQVSSALNLLEGEIDSIILFMEYDTTGLYGMQETPVTIEVRQLRELMDVQDIYFTSNSFETDPVNILGKLENHIPRPFDSVQVITSSDTAFQVPHMRIPLDPGFMDAVLTDSVYLENQDSLNAVFNGFQISMAASVNTMLSFSLEEYSGVTVYYKDQDGDPDEYTFRFGFTTVKTMNQQHDYTGSVVEPFLENQALGDSLYFIQSMTGLNTEVRIDDPDIPVNGLVNHAKLVMYGIELDMDDAEVYPAIEQLVTLDVNNSGDVVYSTDVLLPLSADFGLLSQIFGGTPGEPLEANMRIRKYELTVTSQIQDIFRGERDKLSIASFWKANRASRVVFLGPSHPEYPPRLRLTYSLAP